MSIQQVDWSVVVVGRWNRAILTPKGIAKYVFGLPQAEWSAVMVAVPLDGLLPYQVKHPQHDFVAFTDESRLSILLHQSDYGVLEHALAAGARAMELLPETPVTAAGFNLNYKIAEGLEDIVAADIDGCLGGQGLVIASRTFGRAFEFRDGRLNVTITSGPEGAQLMCNFHRDSTNQSDLIEWLRCPIAEVQAKVESVQNCFLGEILEESVDDRDEQ